MSNNNPPAGGAGKGTKPRGKLPKIAFNANLISFDVAARGLRIGLLVIDQETNEQLAQLLQARVPGRYLKISATVADRPKQVEKEKGKKPARRTRRARVTGYKE